MLIDIAGFSGASFPPCCTCRFLGRRFRPRLQIFHVSIMNCAIVWTNISDCDTNWPLQYKCASTYRFYSLIRKRQPSQSSPVAIANQLPHNCRLLRTLQPRLPLHSGPPWCEEDTQLPSSPGSAQHPCHLSRSAKDTRRKLQVHQ